MLFASSSTVTSNEILIFISLFIILIVSCFLAFAILTSLFINDRKKAYYFIVYMAFGVIFSLIASFRYHAAIGIITLAVYIIFILAFYLWTKRKNSK
ncbi:hypothetical protein [Oceanobacillus neutriphilus]|uniref:DUF2651 domain-containing protein n=1 Tax=Oceanobacillus neutriphilus TaxID=531815 RepID=A0ABQ2NUR9_9BACI|nr:hypothetical protein [Oceanobacillus neutriphilus]GGP10992.1 hypothetical protein GCM10011346_21320 [Oceanobacillus neutriphilus]